MGRYGATEKEKTTQTDAAKPSDPGVTHPNRPLFATHRPKTVLLVRVEPILNSSGTMASLTSSLSIAARPRASCRGARCWRPCTPRTAAWALLESPLPAIAAGVAAPRTSLVVRAEQAAAAPPKPEVGPKRGSQVSRAAGRRAHPADARPASHMAGLCLRRHGVTGVTLPVTLARPLPAPLAVVGAHPQARVLLVPRDRQGCVGRPERHQVRASCVPERYARRRRRRRASAACVWPGSR
jgi:hypothetical protein